MFSAAYYSNLEVRGTATNGNGAFIAPVFSRLMQVLHGHFARYQGQFALDFPLLKPGSATGKPALLGTAIRLFSSTREACDGLLEVIDDNSVLAEYLILGRIRSVPEHPKRYVSVHRVRVAPRNQPNNRLRDLEAQQLRPSPYLRMHSASTGQYFSLILERRLYASPEKESGVPNSYGLSGAVPVFLPDVSA